MTDVLSDQQLEQYYRQVLLPEVEEAGQHALLQHHVLIIGVGGLGTHVAQQLAAAGVGHLHLMDNDQVELSNLPRQILFNPTDIGQLKVTRAQNTLTEHNPNANIYAYPVRFSLPNIGTLLDEKGVNAQPSLKQAIQNGQLTVLDCSDNMATRQQVNLWCVSQGLPLICGAVSGFDGQLLSVTPNSLEKSGCYRCIFNDNEVAQNCASQGVLGPMVATIASMQSLLAIHHIAGLTVPSTLQLFEGKSMQWHSLGRKRDPQCPACRTKVATCKNEQTCQPQPFQSEAQS